MSARILTVAACCLALSSIGAVEAQGAPAGASKAGRVRRIKVITDKATDCSSLKSIVESVTRGCTSNDARAVAVYNFMRLAHYHHAYPKEKAGIGALKEINVYGWSLCGGLHAVQGALWRELGWKWKFFGWPGHTTIQAYYDGRWHFLDVFLKFYTWIPNPDRPGTFTVAGQGDIAKDPSLVTGDFVHDRGRQVWYHVRNQPKDGNWRAIAFFPCRDDPKGVVRGCRKRRNAGARKFWYIGFDSPGYSTDVNLAAGCSLTLTWDPIPGAYWRGDAFRKPAGMPRHACSHREFRNSPVIGPIYEPYSALTGSGKRRSIRVRTYGNGKLVFAPDLSNDAFLAGLHARQNVKVAGGKLVPADASAPASITVRMQSPYVLTRASGRCTGLEAAEVSADAGKTFVPVRLEDFSATVKGKYDVLVRLAFKAPLKSIELTGIVQCNPGALPYLSPGRNTVTVSVADPAELGGNRLAVTYAYQTGFRTRGYAAIVNAGRCVGRRVDARWGPTVTAVRKILTAGDFGSDGRYSFRIDVPTPKGRHPVYPRMLFVRREVLAPGSRPVSVPQGAVPPKVGPDDELKTLPNPFLIGTEMIVGKRPAAR